MTDDLRERIARAIEAEANRCFEGAFTPDAIKEAGRAAAGLHRAAEIARETPDALAELAARVDDLEARLREREASDDGR